MLDETDKAIVRTMQNDIPLVAQPYAAMADALGLSEEEFLQRLKRLKEEGKLRRIGVVLQHRRAGFTANALCVWQVPEAAVDRVGAAVSQEAAVSHCYTRTPVPEFPYNFYAMIHAQSREDCETIANRITAAHDLPKGEIFYSVREWKKISMKYFLDK